MANADKKAAKNEQDQGKAPEKKRTVLTQEQRIAKLEAELKAAREKAEAKANKHFAQLRERRAKLVAKRDSLNEQIAAIDSELPAEKVDTSTPIDEAKAS